MIDVSGLAFDKRSAKGARAERGKVSQEAYIYDRAIGSYDRNRRVYHADDVMERVAAERLIRHLARAGFVVMRSEAGAAPTMSNMPSSRG